MKLHKKTKNENFESLVQKIVSFSTFISVKMFNQFQILSTSKTEFEKFDTAIHTTEWLSLDVIYIIMQYNTWRMYKKAVNQGDRPVP